MAGAAAPASPDTGAAEPLLAVRGLTKRFGGLVAVGDCGFEVLRGSVVGIIGPNGSGKSTLFNLVIGLLTPDAGEVSYAGRRIDQMRLHEIARLGIGRTYQAIRIFRDLPVWMNLEIAAMGRRREGWEAAGRDWLERFGLTRLIDAPADSLSIGQQRLLELAMNLVVRPDFLMLDEPLAGVNPVIRDMIAETIGELRAEGYTFLVIEHHMAFIMRICDRIVVMDHGVKIAEGAPGRIREDPRVLEALLGQTARAVPS